MNQNDAKITIIGAGVVGLAIAYELSKKHENIFVVEKNTNFGEETSARSSEVVHSGLYYPSDSLKTKLCIEGRKLLYEFCDKNGVIYNKCGKIIIANEEEEIKHLKTIKDQAINNGVINIKELSKEEISTIEPNIIASKALMVYDTGVVDTYGFMKELEIHSKNNNVEFVYGSKVIGIKNIDIGYIITVEESSGGLFEFTSDIVINSTGLYSDKISKLLGLSEYELQFCKGEYFAVGNGKNKLVSHLIYPVPNKNLTGLGVHVTIDIDKGMKLGPSTLYQSERNLDYTVDKDNIIEFYNSAKRFLPFINKEDLYPAYSGIRPKLQKEGEGFKDFVIKEETEKGLKNFYNLVGIESPGLTASLAIGKYIERLIN